MSPRSMLPYLPGLPTIEEANKDKSAYNSNNAPFLVTIPLPNTNPIRILSWQMLTPFTELKPGSRIKNAYNNPETDKEIFSRYERVTTVLQVMIKSAAPDFITLQDIDKTTKGFKLLLDKLASDYLPMSLGSRRVDQNDCITLYRVALFTPVINAIAGFDPELKALQGNITKFFSKKNPEIEIRIANINDQTTTYFHQKTNFISEVLAGSDSAKPAVNPAKRTATVVIGHFNAPIANATDKSCNLTTSVCAIYEKNADDILQTAASTQGCFFSLNNFPGHKSKCLALQADIAPYHALTGAALTAEELQPLNATDAFQQTEIDKQRPILDMDATQFIMPAFSLEAANAHFKQCFPNNIIRVYRTTDLNNRKCVGVSMAEDFFNYFKLLNNPQMTGYEDPMSTQAPFLVTTATDHFNLLMIEFDVLKKHPQLVNLANAIYNLETCPHLKAYPENFIMQLSLFFGELRAQKFITDTHDIIMQHFVKFINKMSATPLSAQEKKEFVDELDQALYGKTPLSTNMKILIGAVLGALLGLIVGIAIGIYRLGYSGSISGIPGVFAGIAPGSTVGKCIALSILSGSILGGVKGNIHAKRSQTLFEQQTRDINEKIGQTVIIQKYVLLA